jgi:hypothetical protein
MNTYRTHCWRIALIRVHRQVCRRSSSSMEKSRAYHLKEHKTSSGEHLQIKKLDTYENIGSNTFKIWHHIEKKPQPGLKNEWCEKPRCREEQYREDPLGPGDLVLRKNKARTKLHPRWDGPFVVRASTDKNVYQLQTRNGYVLRHLYNRNCLRQYFLSSRSESSLWFASPDLKKKDAHFQAQENRKTRRKELPVVSESR